MHYKDRVDNIPVLSGIGLHLLPGMNEVLTIKGRIGHDLIHLVSQGNRRFVIIKDPALDMRGFLLELKRITPTLVRGETIVEVTGLDRFIADTVYIPPERQGLYLNENEALKFANGRIIKDSLIKNGEEEKVEEKAAYDREITTKL